MAMDEEDINKLSKELKSFTAELGSFTTVAKELNKKSSSTGTDQSQKISSEFDKSTHKIVNALGVLSAALTRNNRSEAQQTAYLERFNTAVNKSTTTQERAQKAADKVTFASERAALAEAARETRREKAAARQKAADDAAEAAAFAARRSSSMLHGSIFDAIEGIKKFGSAIDQFPKEANDRLATFNNSLRDSSKSLQERISIYRNHDNVGKQTFESLARVGSYSDILATKIDVWSGGSVTAQLATKALSAAFEGAKKSVVGYTSAIYNGERGAKVSAKAITDLATPMVELAGSVGNVLTALAIFAPGGAVVKIVTFIAGFALKLFGEAGKAALKYNELAAEQADKLHASFMELGKGGVNLSGGLTETFDTMQRFGMSVSEATQFTNMLAGSAKDLKYLGVTAGQGAKKFAEVAGTLSKSDLGRDLELMGVSAEEQRESALKFMSIQARTGQIQLNNVGRLVTASAAFTKEMDLAAELAGNTRKEQIESREADMQDFRFRSAMDEAVSTNDTRRVAELELMQAVKAQLLAAGNEEGATGVSQLVTGRGAMGTDASVKANMQLGGGRLYEMISSGQYTTDNIGELMSEISRNSKMMNRTLSGYNQIMGENTGIQTAGVGSFNQQARDDALRKAMKEKDFTGTIDEFLKTEQGKRIESDERNKAQTNILRSQKSTALMMDKFINSFYDTSKINEAAANVFKKAVEEFGGKEVDVAGGTFSSGKKAAASGGSVEGTSSAPAAKAARSSAGVAGSMSTSGGISGGIGGEGDSGSIMDAAAAGAGDRAAQRSAASGEVVSRLLEYIGKKESNGNYNILVGGNSEPGLTGMTVKEVLEFQSGMRQRGHESTAVGKYQILKGTLEGLISNGHAKLDDKFDSATQDKLAIGLLKRRGLDSFQSGKMPKEAFADNLSKEWASLPYHTDQSYYAGVGSNKSSGSRDTFMATLGARTGGIFKGPSTGYSVELHGEEAVIPANEGVSKQALNPTVFNQNDTIISDLTSMFEKMNEKYDTMIELLANGNEYSEKLVAATV